MTNANERAEIEIEASRGVVKDESIVHVQQKTEPAAESGETRMTSGGGAKLPLCDEIEEGRLLARASKRRST